MYYTILNFFLFYLTIYSSSNTETNFMELGKKNVTFFRDKKIKKKTFWKNCQNSLRAYN